MKQERKSWLNRASRNWRRVMLTGLVVLLPIAATVAILQWLFFWVAGFLVGPIRTWLDNWPWLRQGPPLARWVSRHAELWASAISVLTLIVLVYLVGVLSGLVGGRRIIRGIEKTLMRIPLVKTIYGAVKQVVEAVSLPNRQAFKAVVTLEFPAQGMRTIGFITGHINVDGQDYYRVFIPTVPNITTGFFEICSPDRFQMTDMTVEDALKTVISGGILAPASFKSIGMAPDPKQFVAAVEVRRQTEEPPPSGT